MPSKLRLIVRAAVAAIVSSCLSGCITARLQDNRESVTGIAEGEAIVIMARSYHLGNETEAKYINCVEDALSLFPWFEPRTAPAETKGLSKLMARPGVAQRLEDQRVRYIIWLEGDTERVAGGGSLSCAAGPGGGGCFGFAWWQNDADYNASVWDLKGLESAGTVTADVSGTSFLPALVVPIPLIARTQTAACKGLADQLRTFISPDPNA